MYEKSRTVTLINKSAPGFLMCFFISFSGRHNQHPYKNGVFQKQSDKSTGDDGNVEKMWEWYFTG